MNKNLLIGLGVFLAVVASGFFLVRKSSPATNAMPTSGPGIGEQTVSDDATPAREITVTGTEYSFNPASIAVKKGERVRLTFVNAGTTLHNLVIDELNVATKMVSPGKSDTIEFAAEGDGTLAFYCGVSNHKNLGMEGELKIISDSPIEQ